MVRQRLPRSTRPAAGADPFLTIRILKCQTFSENPESLQRDMFYYIIKNSGEKMIIRIRLHVSQVKHTCTYII